MWQAALSENSFDSDSADMFLEQVDLDPRAMNKFVESFKYRRNDLILVGWWLLIFGALLGTLITAWIQIANRS